MADYSRQVISLGREVQYTIPTHEPWGANWNEVLLALYHAVEEYQRMYKIDSDPSDDAIRVLGDEENITIKFAFREEK